MLAVGRKSFAPHLTPLSLYTFVLKHISIKNFSIIDHIEIDWTGGLNILAGETGAGKSILFDALSIVLGAKAGASQIRDGNEKAVIEATFEPSSTVCAWLKQEELIDPDSESELIVYREVTRAGSRARINGMPVNATHLNDLRQLLITFHAQHEIRTLLSHSAQLELLDGQGSKAHVHLKEKLITLYARFKDLKRQYEELQISDEERNRKLDLAKFQLDELSDASLLSELEDQELGDRHKVLANAARLHTSVDKVIMLLSGSERLFNEERKTARDLIQESLCELDNMIDLDAAIANPASFLRESLVNIEEAAQCIRRYRDSLDLDPQSLKEVEDRLGVLTTIKRKYGPTLKDAIVTREKLAIEIEQLENAVFESNAIEKELDDLRSTMLSTSQQLSSERKKLAEDLSKSVLRELADLGMERCRFNIQFTELSEVTQDGLDRIEFLIAPNPGRPPLPLAKIASGGELSRIMLALKTIFARADRVSTVVFDEIDSGLSGRILKAIRDKLVTLARSHQILCITHQPIVASVADNYLIVCKEQSKDKTVITASRLEGEAQLKALAVMASGREEEAVSLKFAQSLMADAHELKGRF